MCISRYEHNLLACIIILSTTTSVVTNLIYCQVYLYDDVSDEGRLECRCGDIIPDISYREPNETDCPYEFAPEAGAWSVFNAERITQVALFNSKFQVHRYFTSIYLSILCR